MTLAFDLEGVETAEFGVGIAQGGSRAFETVPVEAAVKAVLVEMARTTWAAMASHVDGALEYEPSQEHRAKEYLWVPNEVVWEQEMRTLHEAENLPTNADALKQANRVFCYFVRMKDGGGRRLTAMRRATQFKAIQKSRLIRFDTDALRLVADTMFRLDNDFDLLVDEAGTHVWRPAGFESLGRLSYAVMGAAADSVAVVGSALGFVEMDTVESYAASHPRAARYLASIQSQELMGITQEALAESCASTGVHVDEVNGRLEVSEDNVMGLLEVLDRRRYRVALVPNSPERFKAGRRTKL